MKLNLKKRLTALVLCGCMVAGTLPAVAKPAEASTFPDVHPGDWYYEAVDDVSNRNLMVGDSDGNFAPNRDLTRAEFVQILYAKSGKPDPKSTSPYFSDVQPGAWYFNAVQWGKENNVLSGTSDTTFSPDMKVTRAQLVQFLYAYTGKPAVSGTLDFPDVGDVESWSRDALLWATQNGLISGTEEYGTVYLRPLSVATRAMAAVIIRQYAAKEDELRGKDEPTEPTEPTEPDTPSVDPDPGETTDPDSGKTEPSEPDTPSEPTQEESNYSIVSVDITGSTAKAVISTDAACTLKVSILNETTEEEITSQATAAGENLQLGEVSLTFDRLLPGSYLVRAYLLDADGKALCNSYTNRMYTTAGKEFESLTVDDFKDDTVIQFTDETDNNFGVLADSVEEPTVQSGTNVIAETDDKTYTVSNIDSSVSALKSGDEALFYNANGEPVLVSIGTITINGTTATITWNDDATLSDFYDVLKVNQTVDADADDIDMSEADAGVTLEQPTEEAESEDAELSPAIDIIDEDVSDTKKISFGLKFELTYFELSGSVSGSIGLNVKISYDVDLFGPDYCYASVIMNANLTTSADVKLKQDNGDDVKAAKEKAQVKLGKIPFPLGAGFDVYASLTFPLEYEASVGGHIEKKITADFGFSYCTDDGMQEIKKVDGKISGFNFQGQVKITCGPKIELGLEFLKDVLSAGLSAQNGIEGTGTLTTMQESTGYSYHACDLCIDIGANKFIKVGANLKWKITKHLSGTVFDVTFLELKKPLGEFYLSCKNDKNSIYGGDIHFGEGACKNQKYRTTFAVTDENGDSVKNVKITIYRDAKEYTTVTSNQTCYLYPGDYTAECVSNSTSLSKEFTIKESATAVTLSQNNDAILASGTCGDNLTWTLDENGKLTISGTGAMTDWYSSSDVPWYSNRAQIQTVVIRQGVTSIGREAFSYCDKLKSVTIPDSATSIGSSAFYCCDALTSITIPDGVTTIGSSAFLSCDALTNVTIPDSVTSIEDGAFGQCTSLTSIVVDDNNPNYSSEDGVLFNKDKTKLIQYPAKNARTVYTIPDSVTDIEDSAFYCCKALTSVTIPDGVTSIGNGTFRDCRALTSVTIPDGVTSIGDAAFYDCDALTSVTIPDGVTSIGFIAFYDCDALTSMTIGDSVTSIGNYAFAGCGALTSIVVDGNNPNYCSEDGVLFSKDKTKLILYPVKNARTDYKIPNSVTDIGDYAFSGCKNLASATIPDSVTSIGDYAFSGCSSLTSITIPDNLTRIGGDAFSGCTSLTNITIPDSVTSIGSFAFSRCSGLKSITISNSVTSIGMDAFYNCTSLTDVYYTSTEDQWNAISFGDDVWKNTPFSRTIHYNSTGA